MKSGSEECCQEKGGKNAKEEGSVSCPGCGYDLSGRVGPRCSECGLALQVIAADQVRSYRQTGAMLLASWAVLIGVVLGVVFGVAVVKEHRSQVESWEEMQTFVTSELNRIKRMRVMIAVMEGRAGGSGIPSIVGQEISDIEETAGELSSIERPTLVDKRLAVPWLGFGLSLLGLICAALALLANRIVVRSVRDEASGVGKLERRAGAFSFAAVWGCSLALVVLAWETIR